MSDPFRPLLAVQLSITAKGLHGPMQKPLAELKRQCEEARALAALGDFKI